MKRNDLKNPLYDILKNEYYEILEAIEQVNPILGEKSSGKNIESIRRDVVKNITSMGNGE